MNQLPAIEVVYDALNALYHNPDPISKERASQWLGDLQKSIFAWKIADQLLHVKKDMESCYFGAQTLRTKIQFAFHELPSEAHNSLRDSMLNHLRQINEHTNTVIVTQLCLALADLLLQMTSWKTPIQDLIQTFGPKNNFETTHIWPLLEVLTVLPEEMGSRTLRLGANRRSEVLKLFAGSTENVLHLLDSCLTIPSSDRLIGVRLLRCFSSWVHLQAVTLHQLTSCATLGHVFATLSSHHSTPLLHEAASDAVCALLQVVADQENEDNTTQNGQLTSTLNELRTLEDSLVQSIKNLEPAYHLAVAEEDTEKALNYCRVFTEIAEALLHRMLESTKNNNGTMNTSNLFGLLDLVLTCVGHHDYEVAEITFGFWYKLSEDLYHANDDDRTIKFKPYIERLIGAVCRHCQMEPDHEGVLEESDDFAGFRSRVSELVKDVVFIVGSASVFKHCFYSIHGQNNLPWEVTESALFIMQAVAKNILPDENEVVQSVVESLLQVPESAHAAVRFTTLLLLGELGEWMDKHPAVVEPVLHCVLRSINDPSLAVAASNSLEAITSICRDHVKSHFDILLQVVSALVTLPIPTETAVRVVKGVTKVCSRLPDHQIADALHQLCKIHVDELTRICQVENQSKVVAKTSSDPVYWLDRLASIFRNLSVNAKKSEQHPCQLAITFTWPCLSMTLDKFQTDRRVMERCCRCLRFALRLIGHQSAPLLQPLVTQMVRLYNAHHHSCFLYLASILVDEYGSENDCIGGLISMLEALLPRAFQLLQEPQGLCHNPDTVDDLFRLFARFLQRNPAAFLHSPALPAIFDCAMQAAALDHRDANASVMQFLSELIHTTRTREEKLSFELRDQLMSTMLRPKGPILISTLITASIFSLSTCSLPNVADVLLEFMLVDRQSISSWMEQTLENLPRQSPSGCVAVRPEQLQDFRHKVIRAETSLELSNALRDFSRLYR